MQAEQIEGGVTLSSQTTECRVDQRRARCRRVRTRDVRKSRVDYGYIELR